MREEHNAYVLSCTATHWVVTQSTTDIFDERAGNATTPHIYTRAPPSVSIYLDIDLITSILHWFPSILIRFECKWYADGLHHTVLFFPAVTFRLNSLQPRISKLQMKWIPNNGTTYTYAPVRYVSRVYADRYVILNLTLISPLSTIHMHIIRYVYNVHCTWYHSIIGHI